jgi:hypothetical protein
MDPAVAQTVPIEQLRHIVRLVWAVVTAVVKGGFRLREEGADLNGRLAPGGGAAVQRREKA